MGVGTALYAIFVRVTLARIDTEWDRVARRGRRVCDGGCSEKNTSEQCTANGRTREPEKLEKCAHLGPRIQNPVLRHNLNLVDSFGQDQTGCVGAHNRVFSA
jgi:hypothetical protein